MKKHFKLLVVFMLVFAFMLGLASCKKPGEPSVDPNVPPVEVPPEINIEECYRIRFVYSYTALVTNANGREDYKDEEVTVQSIYIPMADPVMTDEIKEQIKNFSYNGYKFTGWYYEWDVDTQSPVGDKIDFDAFEELDGDIEIFGDRGDLAGDAAAWKAEFFNSKGEPVAIEDVIANKSGLDVKEGTLTISGEGDMFNFKNADAVDIPWYQFRTKLTKIVVEDGITSIGSNSFSNCTKVKEVILPDSIVTIGDSAFSGCTNKAWRYLELPAGVKTVGANAFNGTSFKEVVLNDGLEIISDQAFYGSNSMKTVVIPASLKEIGIGAFHPGSVGSSTNSHALGKVYFKGASTDEFKAITIKMDNIWLTDYPTIYAYTEDEALGNTGAYWHYAENADGEITDNPVQYCYTISYKLPNANLYFTSQSIPVSVVIDENGDIVTDDDGIAKLEGIITQDIIDARNNITYHNMKFVGFTPVGSAPKELNAGDVINADIAYTVDRGNILSDGGGIIWSYDGSETLTVSKNPDAPEGASFKIWDFADALDTGALWTNSFSTVNKIKTLVIGDGVEHIGTLAFANLTGISQVVLPLSVESVASDAFSGCAALNSIYYMGADAKNCTGLLNEDGSLALVETNAKVYSKVETAVAVPGSYWMILTDNSGKEKRISWSISADENGEGGYTNGHLIIGGDDVMINFAHPEQAPWYGAKNYITTVTFESNITALGENALSGYAGVTTINLPNSLRVVPASALEGTGVVNNRSAYNKGLLVLNGVLVKVDPSKMNRELIETYIGVNIIAGGAFDNITELQRIYIAATVRYINPGAFDDCAKLSIIYFDGTPGAFKDEVTGEFIGVAVDAGFGENVNVFYKAGVDNGTGYGYWEKVGDDYVMTGCNHKFGEWTEVKAENCLYHNTEVRYCIYDETHTETRELETYGDHNYEGALWVIDSAATCYSNEIHKMVCNLSTLGCGGVEYKEVEGTQLSHNFPDDYTPDFNATCTEDGTMSRACQNEGCTVVDEVSDPSNPKTGHSFTNYQYDKPDCLENDGSWTAICDNGCGEENHGTDPDFVVLGDHNYGEWIPDGNATCIQDGTKTKTCSVCGEYVTETDVNSMLVQPHVYTREDDSYEYYSSISDDSSVIYFFKSCALCEVKGPYTFEKPYKSSDGVDGFDYPGGMTINGTSISDMVPDGSDVKQTARILSEEVAEAVNYFIRFQRLNNSAGSAIQFYQDHIEGVDTYYYQHSFRWLGADKVRDKNWPMTTKLLSSEDGKTEIHTGPVNFYATVGEQDLKVGGANSAVIAPYGEWVTFLYELTKNSNNTWTLTMYVNGVQAVKTTSRDDRTCATVPILKYEPRGDYGNDKGSTNDLIIDFDNVSAYSALPAEYVSKVCEGEHNFGMWSYNGDADCDTAGTESCVCLNDRCNVVETRDSADHPMIGHSFGDWEYNGKTDCTTPGTKTRACSICGETETVDDEEHPATAGHNMSDYIYNNDATCTVDGTKTATCQNPECTVTDTKVDDDHLMIGHSFADHVYDGNANCTDNGTMTATCANGCGVTQTIDDPEHTATGHQLSDWVYDGKTDCTVAGTKTRTCTNEGCEYLENEADAEHPATAGHNMSEFVYNNDATCVAAGTKTSTCQNPECTVSEKVEDTDHPMAGHSFADHVYNNDATCTVDGTMTATCANGCGETETIPDPEHTKTGHSFVDHVYDGNADCATAGTMTAACANGCGETETIEDPEHPALGHSFVDYYYNGDQDCDTNGTETAWCDRDGCDATDTRDAAGKAALGHIFRAQDYVAIPNSATCLLGNATTAECFRDNCDATNSSYDDQVLDYHSFVEVRDEKYFAGYSEDLTSVNFYMSCEWCGCKSHFKFAEPVFAPDTSLSEGKLPSFISDLGVSLTTGSSVPTASGAYVTLINNDYLAVGKNNSGGESGAFRLNLDKDNLDREQIFEFDFMWRGATPVAADSDADATFMKFYYWDSTGARKQATYTAIKGNTTDSKGNVKLGDQTIVCDEWNKVVMKFTPVDGGKVKITVTVNGNAVSISNATAAQAIEQVHIHTRGDSYWTSVHMSFKNISRYVITDDTYSLTNTNCADGEHKLGDFVYNNDGTCLADGTHTAICQNGTCTYTVTEFDPDHKASGHNFANYVYNNDAICTVSGTMTAVCENGCGETDTKDDPGHPATGNHKLSDWIYNNDQSCEKVGTLTQSCANCSFSETKKDAENYPALVHAEGQYTAVENSANCEHGTLFEAVCVNGCGKTYSYYGEDKLDHDYQQIITESACVLPANTKTAAIYKESCSMCGLLSETTFNYGEAIASESFNGGTLPSYIKATLSDAETGAYNIFKDEDGNKFWRIGKDSSSGSENVIYWVFETANVSSNNLWFDFRWNGGTHVSDNYSGYAKFYQSGSQITNDNLVSKAEFSSATLFGATLEIEKWYTINIVFEYTAEDKTNIIINVYDAELNVVGTYSATNLSAIINEFTIHPRWNCYSVSFDFDNVALVSEHSCSVNDVVSFDFLKSVDAANNTATYYKSCPICQKKFDETFTVNCYTDGTLPSYVTISKTPYSAATEGEGDNANDYAKFFAASGGEQGMILNFDGTNNTSQSYWFDFRWQGGTCDGGNKNSPLLLKILKADGNASGASHGGTDNQSTPVDASDPEAGLYFLGITDMLLEKGVWYTFNIKANFTSDGKTELSVTIYDSNGNAIGTHSWGTVASVIAQVKFAFRWNWINIGYDVDNIILVNTPATE